MDAVQNEKSHDAKIAFVCQHCGFEFESSMRNCKIADSLDIFMPHFVMACECPECNRLVRDE